MGTQNFFTHREQLLSAFLGQDSHTFSMVPSGHHVCHDYEDYGYVRAPEGCDTFLLKKYGLKAASNLAFGA